MGRKHLLLLFLLTLIPFLIFMARPDFVGGDTYYFLNNICGEGEISDTDLIRTIFGFLPCNFLALKTLLFVLCLTCTITLALTGDLWDKKRGWMAGLFVFLSPIYFLEFTKLENDQFAYPLLFMAIYFFYKGYFKNKFYNHLVALVLILFASQIWGGSIFFLLAFAFGSIIFLITTIPAIVLFWKKLFFTVLPRFPTFEWLTWENAVGFGIFWLFLLLMGYIGISRILLPQLLFFTALLLFNSKFVFLAIPFLALAFVNYYNKLDKTKYGKTFQQIFLWLPFFLAISWGIVSWTQPPQPYQWEAIDYALEQSPKPGITNDWDFGYWILYKGGRTQQFGASQDFNAGHDIVLTRRELDCNMLRQFEDLRVYKC